MSDPKGPAVVILFGVSGSGKSTLGAALAQRIGATFLEGDAFHPPANIAKMTAGRALDDRDRAPWLAAIGRAIQGEVRSGRRVVAACSALHRAYRDKLREVVADHTIVFVELDAPQGELDRRVTRRTDHFMPRSLLASQLAALEPLQSDETGFRIETGTDAADTLARIAARL